jgi:glucuronate isomerase
MSFPRHEYFRRLLCNLFGEEIEKGELPNDIVWVGKIIKDICFYNAQNYFNLQAQTSKIINPNEIALKLLY